MDLQEFAPAPIYQVDFPMLIVLSLTNPLVESRTPLFAAFKQQVFTCLTETMSNKFQGKRPGATGGRAPARGGEAQEQEAAMVSPRQMAEGKVEEMDRARAGKEIAQQGASAKPAGAGGAKQAAGGGADAMIRGEPDQPYHPSHHPRVDERESADDGRRKDLFNRPQVGFSPDRCFPCAAASFLLKFRSYPL